MPYDIQTLLVNDMTIDEEVKTLNELLKEKNAELNNHKKKRDNYQEQARTQQMKRDNYKELSRKHMSKINELKTERDYFNQLTREAKAQRESLTEKINEARANGVRDLGAMKEERDAYHRSVVENHAKSQAIHEQIEKIKLEVDAARSLADQCHQLSLELREAADREHQEFVRCLNELRELQDELPDTL